MKPEGTDDGGKELPPEIQQGRPIQNPEQTTTKRPDGRKRRGWAYLIRSAAIMLACSVPVGRLLEWLIRRFGVAERYEEMIFIVLGISGLGFIAFSLYRILRADPDL